MRKPPSFFAGVPKIIHPHVNSMVSWKRQGALRNIPSRKIELDSPEHVPRSRGTWILEGTLLVAEFVGDKSTRMCLAKRAPPHWISVYFLFPFKAPKNWYRRKKHPAHTFES